MQANDTKANCLAQNADADETGSDECDEWDEWDHVFAEQWQRHQYESIVGDNKERAGSPCPTLTGRD